MSFDEYGVDLSAHDLAVEQQESEGRMEVRRIEKMTADRDRLQSINTMLIGQISRLVYVFHPDGGKLDTINPRSLETVVKELIDRATKAFTEAQIGYELTGQVTALNRENIALSESVRDHQKYQNSVRKAITDSGLLEGVRDLDSMHLDEVVDKLVKAGRRNVEDLSEVKRIYEDVISEIRRRIICSGLVSDHGGLDGMPLVMVVDELIAACDADSEAKAEQGRAALEMDAKNLRQINRCLTITLGDIDNLLENIGFHGERMIEEHLSANAQLIFFDAVEAVGELKELRTKVESLRALKIEPTAMVSAAWDALRKVGVNTVNHGTLADAIGWLGQRHLDVCREANRLTAEANNEPHTEFINGVLTVHTEGATVIIVDRNA